MTLYETLQLLAAADASREAIERQRSAGVAARIRAGLASIAPTVPKPALRAGRMALCATCGRRHVPGYTFNGRYRTWHEADNERRRILATMSRPARPGGRS